MERRPGRNVRAEQQQRNQNAAERARMQLHQDYSSSFTRGGLPSYTWLRRRCNQASRTKEYLSMAPASSRTLPALSRFARVRSMSSPHRLQVTVLLSIARL